MESNYFGSYFLLKLRAELPRGRKEGGGSVDSVIGKTVAGGLCEVDAGEPISTKN